MTPASVGSGANELVLGKHSGRHAFGARLQELGLTVDAGKHRDGDHRALKELADRTQVRLRRGPAGARRATPPSRGRKLVRYQVLSGTPLPPTATVEVEMEGHRRSASALGNGPLDAALKAADAALGFELQLLEIHTRAVTAGKDALAEVSVRVRHDGIESLGQAASRDTHRGDAQGLPVRGRGGPGGAGGR